MPPDVMHVCPVHDHRGVLPCPHCSDDSFVRGHAAGYKMHADSFAWEILIWSLAAATVGMVLGITIAYIIRQTICGGLL